MSTSRSEIEEWVRAAYKKGCTHLIVVCDDFSLEDFPVEVFEGDDIEKKIEEHGNFKTMQRIMEVYSMKLPLDLQLAERRAWHPDHT
jgi:hypothetical protein